eukprot:3355732-Alexandrium_andersonii.AAC.1
MQHQDRSGLSLGHGILGAGHGAVPVRRFRRGAGMAVLGGTHGVAGPDRRRDASLGAADAVGHGAGHLDQGSGE